MEKYMTNNIYDYELNVLVKNKQIPEYFHNQQTYICGFEDAEFELELKNNSDKIVLMIPSVDGLSCIDGQEASENSQGYLVRPKSSVKVPGWTLDNDTVAKFKFADKKKSYAAIHPDTPKTDNVGVIGVIVYSRKENESDKLETILERIKELEKKNPIIINPIYPWYDWYHSDYYYRQNRPYLMPVFTCGSPSVGSGVGIGTTSWSANGSGINNAVSVNTIFSNASLNSCNVVNTANVQTNDSLSIADVTQQDFSLGTEFGESVGFKSNTVSFERDSIVATLVVYYDSRKNLEKRGIIVVPVKEEVIKTPNPFPKLGCKPPAGWSEKS